MDKQQNNINGIINKINQTYSKHKPQNISKNKINDDGADSVELENAENLSQNPSNNEENNQIEEMKLNNTETDKIEELTKKIEDLTNANSELEDMLKRRVAEFENFKRRTDKEKMELLEYGNIKLFMKFVDLLDDLKNAKQAANNTEDISSVITGLEMINQKTEKLFADEGVLPMEVNIGDEFDVEKHEAMMRQPSDLPEGQITMIIQNGYVYKEKVIRYAKVATSAGNI
jgi:molecular chaperone GrpE